LLIQQLLHLCQSLVRSSQQLVSVDVVFFFCCFFTVVCSASSSSPSSAVAATASSGRLNNNLSSKPVVALAAAAAVPSKLAALTTEEQIIAAVRDSASPMLPVGQVTAFLTSQDWDGLATALNCSAAVSHLPVVASFLKEVLGPLGEAQV